MVRTLPLRLAMLFGMAGLLMLCHRAAAEEGSPGPEPRPGQLLVASAAIGDPRFHHSVILLLGHDSKGAFGLIVNRPLGERPLASLLAAAGGEAGKDSDDSRIEGTIRIFFGGPVQPQLGFVIHGSDYSRPETQRLGELAMTASKDILRDIGRGKGPAQYLFVLGYAGWGAGQLDGELARGNWFTAPADRDLVFEADRGSVWDKALARRTREM